MYMQQNFDELEFLVGDAKIVNHMTELPVKPVFDERRMEFLGALSHCLLTNPECKSYADVMSYAFWIRRKSIEKASTLITDLDLRMGRGISFHIAPSNVPVNFAVSMTSAWLAGNACIIRVSSKKFIQTDLIVSAINELLEDDYNDLKQYLCIIRYSHSKEWNDFFTKMADIRIIWGGNQTIKLLRESELMPRSYDMTFADRHSIAIINADKLLDDDIHKVASDFYTDTYYTDQNACSSPRIIFWVGEQKEKAKKYFYEQLLSIVSKIYEFQPIMASDKLLNFMELAAVNQHVHLISEDNYCVRVSVDEVSSNLMKYKCGAGFFFEYDMKQLSDMTPILDKACQTVAYYGINPDDILELVRIKGCKGVDRIVPIGQTMELAFTWDGYRMIENMSRIIYIK